ncbi:MAG: T9SS type A sorting domain-containing protein [Flavobacteriales bacterium]
MAQAQVSAYAFTQTVGTYTEITAVDGGYVLGTPLFFPPLTNLRAYVDPEEPDGTVTNAGYLDPAIGPGYPIGFDFVYNGEVFDRIGIAHGGWISFGKSENGDEAVNIFTSDHPGGRPLSHSYYATPIDPHKRNRIAGMANSSLRQQDQSQVGGPTSEFRVATIGTAPNRVCVIQWKDFRYNYSFDQGLINFQIRLNEVDNSVDVRFGEMNWPQTTGAAFQVGLGGRTNEDYSNRWTPANEPSFLYDWNTTVPGFNNESSCQLATDSPFNEAYTATPPVVGLNFHWAAPTCPPPAWPVDVSEVLFDRALLQWSFPPTSSSFDYVVTMANDPEDPDAITSGTTEEVSVLVEGLQPLTYYYVFVRSDCGGVPGPWSTGTRFRTNGGAVLQCGEDAIQEYHCSGQNSTVQWFYSTSNASSPVRISFQQGYVGMADGEYLRIHDGPDADAPVIFTASFGEELADQVVTSTGGTLYMERFNGVGSCESQPWYTPWIWTVGCKDCNEALASFAVVDEDCEAQTYAMQVTVVSMGTAEELMVTNSQNEAVETISATGTYVVGPFVSGEPVILTLENPANALCDLESIPFVNQPCAIVDCGPTAYTFCHEQGDQRQWLFQGEGGSIGIRFFSGDGGSYVDAATYDALDPFSVAGVDIPGTALLNLLRVSTNEDDALLLEINVDGNASPTCADGGADAWEFVVACYDGCTQPQATFTAVEDCANEEFSIEVALSALGSTGAVVITNDAGAPAVEATALGTYTIGPFPSQEVVRVEVEGASVLCSWTSPSLTFDCTGVGVEEGAVGDLLVYPNPSNGVINVRLPDAMQGPARMRVRDLTGRSVSLVTLDASTTKDQSVSLADLPSGSYIIELDNARARHSARINLLH